MNRDVSSEPALDESVREARAAALLESLFEQGAVTGVAIDDASLRYAYLSSGVPGDVGERVTTLASGAWFPRVGRADLGLAPVEARVSDNGHVSSIVVPVARIFDEGERVSAAVAESEAEALFVQKAQAALTLEGWSVESPTGQLSLPLREAGETAEVSWVGMYVAVSEDGGVGRRTAYIMSMSDADAPLTEP